MVKQIFAALIALLGLSATAAAQTNTPAPAQPCALPSVADSVALNPVPGSDLVTVPVEINGKPKQFLLNIGTNASEVSQAMVDELHLTEGLKRTETFQSGPADQSEANTNRIMTVGATVQATLVDVKGAHNVDDGRSRVNIPSFTIGNATGKNLQFVVANDREIGKSAPYDGLMTGSFFKNYDIELDFYGNKLNYLTPTSCADPHQVVFWPHTEVAIIPTNMADGKIEVQVNVNGQLINAILDTSSPQTVMRRDIAELKLGLKANTPTMMPDGDLEDGRGLQVYKAFFKQITFAGGVTAINVPVQIRSNSMIHNVGREPTLGSRAQFNAEPRIPELTLGMDVLHQLHLYVVPAQGNMYVTAAQ
ncbi:MAG: aspartyl protease family protein [Rhizomicrobium sp.]